MAEKITLRFSCVGRLNDSSDRFRYKEHAQESGQYSIASGDITSPDCDRLISLIREQGLRIAKCDFGSFRSFGLNPETLEQQTNIWEKPDEDWVGGVLGAEDGVDISGNNAFDPRCQSLPHDRIVLDSHPIRIDERPPRGTNIAYAEENYIFSDKACQFLRSWTSCTVHDVIFRDKVLAGWHRCLPQEMRDVLAITYFRPYRCAGCGAPGLSNLGVWLGRREPGLTICLSSRGPDHLRTAYEYVFSVEVAQRFAQQFPPSLVFPIIDVDSEPAQKMLQLVEQIKQLPFVSGSWSEFV
jgi:hypothetical protein